MKALGFYFSSSRRRGVVKKPEVSDDWKFELGMHMFRAALRAYEGDSQSPCMQVRSCRCGKPSRKVKRRVISSGKNVKSKTLEEVRQRNEGFIALPFSNPRRRAHQRRVGSYRHSTPHGSNVKKSRKSRSFAPVRSVSLREKKRRAWFQKRIVKHLPRKVFSGSRKQRTRYCIIGVVKFGKQFQKWVSSTHSGNSRRNRPSEKRCRRSRRIQRKSRNRLRLRVRKYKESVRRSTELLVHTDAPKISTIPRKRRPVVIVPREPYVPWVPVSNEQRLHDIMSKVKSSRKDECS